MTYGLTYRELEQWPVVPISEEEFRALQTAKSGLLAVLNIEHKFAILLENYKDYELELVGISVERMVHADWFDLTRDSFSLNRRLVNLLTSTRLYCDQVAHDIAKVSTSASEVLNGALQREHSEQFAYRIMDALRNHAQHFALPITSTTYDRSWEDRPGAERAVLRYGITALLDVSQLRENPKFKKALIDELIAQGGPDRRDITPWVRGFVESFGRIHGTLRGSLVNDFVQWRTAYEAAFKAIEGQLPTRNYVHAVSLDTDGEVSEEVAVVPDLFESIDRLKRRNDPKLMASLSKWYLSTEPR